MLLDGSIKEHNVDSNGTSTMLQPGCLSQSASFKVVELDFLTYLIVVAEP
jgi:hypothetical protein